MIFPLVMFLFNGILFTGEGSRVFSQTSFIGVNITARQAVAKKFNRCKVTFTVKPKSKTTKKQRKILTLTCEKLDSIENPFTALIKFGLNNNIVNNKTPRDFFLLLYPYAQKINDTAYYLYALPLADTSFATRNWMGSHPWIDPQIICFDYWGKIKYISSGGGAGEECCAGGDRWYQTIWFKDNICYDDITHTQQPNENTATEWDASHSYPISVTKSIGDNVNYSKTMYSYCFKRGILYKLIELIQDNTSAVNKTIVYKYHYKK